MSIIVYIIRLPNYLHYNIFILISQIKMKELGIISEEEFEAKKKELLAQI